MRRHILLLFVGIIPAILSGKTTKTETKDSLCADSLTMSANIIFPMNKAVIVPSLGDNRSELERIHGTLGAISADTTLHLQRLVISGFSSPDGPTAFNRRLSRARTDSLRSYVSRTSHIPYQLIDVHITPEDWAGVERFIRESSTAQLPHRDRLLEILQRRWPEEIKERQMRRRYPQDFRYLLQHCMPLLRRTEFAVDYLHCVRVPVVVPSDSMLTDSLLPPPTLKENVVEETEDESQITKVLDVRTFGYLRTNLLLPLLNIGFEVPLGNRWSVAADWYYPWIFRSSSHKNCYQLDGLSLEGRYWFGRQHTPDQANKSYRLLGHSVGLFTMGGRYDLEHNYKGHQGEYILGGIDYLYAKPIFKGRMHLEFSFGIGYLYTRATQYEVYVRGGKGYRDKNFRKNIQYFGPLRASISLVLPLRWPLNKTFTQ